MTEQLEWSTVKRKINDLVPYDYNARILTEEKKEVLIRSINKYGFVEIPVIDIDNTLLAGHQRCFVMKLLGRGEEIIDARIPNRKLTEKEFKEYNIQSNVSIGYWDVEMLKTAFADIDLMALGLDIESIQIPDSLRGSAEEKPDEALPVPDLSQKDPLIKPGDLFTLNDHVLMCGDSTVLEQVQALMEEELAHLNLSDPPYNVDYEGGTGLKIENDKMDDQSFYKFLLAAFTNMYAIAHPGSPIYIFFAEKEGINFRQSFIDAGFKLSQCLVWVKNAFVLGRHDYHWKHEPVLYGWREGAAHRWYGDRNKNTVLELDLADIENQTKPQLLKILKELIGDNYNTTVVKNDRPLANDVHPTMKPIKLLNNLMLNSSLPGDIVADLFGGSGSTMISAEQLNRKARLMEFDTRYCEVIIRRYANYMAQIGKPFTFQHLNGSLSLKEIIENV
jgi:DNA modification methylase